MVRLFRIAAQRAPIAMKMHKACLSIIRAFVLLSMNGTIPTTIKTRYTQQEKVTT